MIDNYVTGTSGFIGSHLCQKLCGDTFKKHHGSECFLPARRYFVLGAYGNMAHQTDAITMYYSNVEEPSRLAIEARAVKECESFVFVSTSSVKLPVQTPYSRTKRAAEEVLLSLDNLPLCIVRPFSVTGVGEQRSHLIPTLIRSCLHGERMKFDPAPVHDFIDVDDLCDQMIDLANACSTGVFEIGKGIGVRNAEVRELVEDVCGTTANAEIVSGLRSYDNQKWHAETLTDAPVKSLRKSIEEMVEAYRNYMKTWP